MNRNESIRNAESKEFDLCIIGGGITGAGILANAVDRGYKAVLIEKKDFASGTSSRSSKMIHGGLRYLKYFQFKLVYEALHERGNLLKLFPHLVKPMPFLLPSFHSKADLVIKDWALTVYDWLAGKSIIPPHIKLNAKEVLDKLPGFKPEGLKGGIYYWDAWTNDARLTVDVLNACELKGSVVLNYTEADQFILTDNTVSSVKCIDKISGKEIIIRAKIFVNASGVWTDEVLNKLPGEHIRRMVPTKGVHVVIPSSKLPSNCVSVVTSQSGVERFLYTLPWEHGLTILGATDTDYSGKPDSVETAQEDIQYILDSFNANYPQVNLTSKDIVCVFAGLRPLLAEGNISNAYSRSREYNIWWSNGNFLNIAGGKLTSFLSMGKRCLDVIDQKSGIAHVGRAATNNSDSYNGKWKATYGNFGSLVEEIIAENAAYDQPISENFSYKKAEIIFFTRHQFAQEEADVLTRRTSITYAMKELDEKLVENVAALMAKELGKDESWIEEQKIKYRQHWREYHPAFLESN